MGEGAAALHQLVKLTAASYVELSGTERNLRLKGAVCARRLQPVHRPPTLNLRRSPTQHVARHPYEERGCGRCVQAGTHKTVTNRTQAILTPDHCGCQARGRDAKRGQPYYLIGDRGMNFGHKHRAKCGPGEVV